MRTLQRTMITLLLAAGVAGCSDDRPVADAPATVPRAAVKTDGTPVGTIEARVTYAGSPVVQTLKINKDVEQCGTKARIEKVTVGAEGGLAHAVVSVRDVEGPSTTRVAQLDQRGCEFRPHVVAMEPGEIEILNSDGVLHNLHTYSEANPAINKAQPGFKKVMRETFTKPEIIKVRCDIHSWMLGWIVVLPHPYFGVTDARGTARIEGVPAGPHTLEVWHEELGRRTVDVTVKTGETAQVAVEFPAAR